MRPILSIIVLLGAGCYATPDAQVETITQPLAGGRAIGWSGDVIRAPFCPCTDVTAVAAADGHIEVLARSASDGSLWRLPESGPDGLYPAFGALRLTPAGERTVGPPSALLGPDGLLYILYVVDDGVFSMKEIVGRPDGTFDPPTLASPWCGPPMVVAEGYDPATGAGGALRAFASYPLTGELWVARRYAVFWAGWINLGVPPSGLWMVGQPQAVTRPDGTIFVVVRDSGGAAWARAQSAIGGAFSPWESIGGALADTPRPAVDDRGLLVLVGSDASGNGVINRQDNAGLSWLGWQPLLGMQYGASGAVHFAPARSASGGLLAFGSHTDPFTTPMWGTRKTARVTTSPVGNLPDLSIPATLLDGWIQSPSAQPTVGVQLAATHEASGAAAVFGLDSEGALHVMRELVTASAPCACTGWKVCTSAGACVDPPDKNAYRVGACYHTPTDVLDDAFVNHYHEPGVRAQVQSQLQTMAASGAGVVKTIVWYGSDPVVTETTNGYLSSFPPSFQQIANLRAYVTDVAATRMPNGQPLELYISTDGNWIGGPNGGSPTTYIGEGQMPPDVYLARLRRTFDSLLAAVRGVYRPDGRPATTLLYFRSELQTCATLDDTDVACVGQWNSLFHNQQWIMLSNYPDFIARARDAGIIPSIYFLASSDEASIMDEGWTDPQYPALNYHLSMWGIYRTLRFMQDNGLPLPERFDASFFQNNVARTNHATVLDRQLEDLEAILPLFYSGPLRYAIVESSYLPTSDPLHTTYGKAFGAERLLRGTNPEVVAFWPMASPMPYTQYQPPFDFSAYDTSSIITPFAALNPSFEQRDFWTNLPVYYNHLVPASKSFRNAWWVSGAGALDGNAILRLNPYSCPTCEGVVSTGVAPSGGNVLVARVYERNAAEKGAVVSLLGTRSGTTTRLANVGSLTTGGNWRRYVVIAPVPRGTTQVGVEFMLSNAPVASFDFDLLH